MDPIGRDACELPQVAGPCDGYYTRWSYDAKSKNCKQFQYGGCLGNNNRVSIYMLLSNIMIRTNFGMNNPFLLQENVYSQISTPPKDYIFKSPKEDTSI